MVKKTSLWPAFILSFCTTDPVPDEDYEVPTSNFPLLGTVPSRPDIPDRKAFIYQHQRLQKNHDYAVERKSEIIKPE